MDALKSSFLLTTTPLLPSPNPPSTKPRIPIHSSVTPDPWSLSDGNDPSKPKPRSKNSKNPLSDDNARRIIKAKASYLSQLRKNQGPRVQTPRWIKRSPEQMVQYLPDDRTGHLYGRHVVAAIRQVRALAEKAEGGYDMRQVMASFVGKLSYREMCTVLKEQRGWRQARDFFAWMKLQVGHCLDFSGKLIIILAGFGEFHIWVFASFWKSNFCHFCLGIILLGGLVCEGFLSF